MTARTLTQSLESETEPNHILRFLADPRNIPAWAPVFADAVREEAGARWMVTKADQDFALRVAVNENCRTVDYLREIAPGKEGGAYIRVLPRPGGGSVIVMTLPAPPGADREKIAAILSAELAELARLTDATA